MQNKIELMYSQHQGRLVNGNIMKRIEQVLAHQQFIMGAEVKEIERTLAGYYGANYAVACANGTDALTLALMAFELKPRDVVFTANFTYSATPESICLLGGVPYFVDVKPDSFNICPAALELAVQNAISQGHRIRGVITVDLFGHPCDYTAIQSITRKYGLFHISDAAQSFGALYEGKAAGGMADITTTSFFPTKPLGCYGDGGMLFTNDANLAGLIRSLTQHGKGEDKYNIVRIGMNSRLDTIQAAVLLEKMEVFPQEVKSRNELAAYYNTHLQDIINTPATNELDVPVWAVYSLLHPKRDVIISALKDKGIPSNIYYPLPLHQQPAYSGALRADSLSNSQRYANEVFCLPMHGYVRSDEREYIVNSLKEIIGRIDGK